MAALFEQFLQPVDLSLQFSRPGLVAASSPDSALKFSQQPPQRLMRLESLGELWGLAIFFGGLALSQIALVAGYVQFGTTPPRALAAAGGAVLLWGISIGRLSLRRQLRLESSIDGKAH